MKKAILAIGFLAVVGPASAAILTVKADGTGEYPTVQAAVNAAANGDIVDLESGIYTGAGNRDVDLQGKAITVRSQGGDPSLCAMDCDGSSTAPRRGFQLAAGSILEGLTVRNGYHTTNGGGAVAPASATIRHCVFSGNQTSTGDWWGGALDIVGPSLVQDCEFTDNRSGDGGAISADNAVVIDNCSFTGNTASEGQAVEAWACTIRNSRFIGNGDQHGQGGAITVGDGCVVEDCYFQSNTAERGGAINLLPGANTVTRATFAANQAEYGGACSAFGGGRGTIWNCTFYGNTASYGSVFYADGNGTSHMNNCIVAFNLGATPILHNSSYHLTFACTDIFGNEGGDWVPGMGLGIDGNVCLDPSFCDVQSGDFHLQDSSPCAPFSPQNPTCDLVGAWPVGCTPTPIQDTSWGRLKTIFR